MRLTYILIAIAGGLTLAATVAPSPASGAEQNSLIINFTDGHQQTTPTAEITRIEFKDSAMILYRGGHAQSIPMTEIAHIEFDSAAASSSMGRGRFLGKWKVGDGSGSSFYITLERNGRATRSLHYTHGTWSVVDGEARITWDDNWHDVIRKSGNRYEKVAFGPGKTFSDHPDNVTDATNAQPEPL
jgi:hypothetical protein